MPQTKWLHTNGMACNWNWVYEKQQATTILFSSFQSFMINNQEKYAFRLGLWMRYRKMFRIKWAIKFSPSVDFLLFSWNRSETLLPLQCTDYDDLLHLHTCFVFVLALSFAAYMHLGAHIFYARCLHCFVNPERMHIFVVCRARARLRHIFEGFSCTSAVNKRSMQASSSGHNCVLQQNVPHSLVLIHFLNEVKSTICNQKERTTEPLCVHRSKMVLMWNGAYIQRRS